MVRFLGQRLGFTLIELLVVISIIGILSTIGMAVYSGVRGKADEGKRRADVVAISKALELKYDPETFQYSSPTAADFSNGDPRVSGNYIVSIPSPATSFRVCTPIGSGVSTDCESNVASPDTNKCYCVSSTQGRYVAAATPTPTSTPTPTPTPPTDPCIASQTGKNLNDQVVIFSGGAYSGRSYKLHYPTGYNPSAATITKLPIVLALHGLGKHAYTPDSPLPSFEDLTGLNTTANSNNFMVIYPQASTNNSTPASSIASLTAWNAGTACCSNTGADDVGFIDAVVTDIKTRLCIEPKKIYATGTSNGAMMAYRLACERNNTTGPYAIAAIAPVAGANVSPACSLTRAVPVKFFHHLGDSVVPFSGGASSIAGITLPPVYLDGSAFFTRASCSGSFPGTLIPSQYSGDTYCYSYTCSPANALQQCIIVAGPSAPGISTRGHTWQGSSAYATAFGGSGGIVNTDNYSTIHLDTAHLNMNQLIWNFFNTFPLP